MFSIYWQYWCVYYWWDLMWTYVNIFVKWNFYKRDKNLKLSSPRSHPSRIRNHHKSSWCWGHLNKCKKDGQIVPCWPGSDACGAPFKAGDWHGKLRRWMVVYIIIEGMIYIYIIIYIYTYTYVYIYTYMYIYICHIGKTPWFSLLVSGFKVLPKSSNIVKKLLACSVVFLDGWSLIRLWLWLPWCFGIPLALEPRGSPNQGLIGVETWTSD